MKNRMDIAMLVMSTGVRLMVSLKIKNFQKIQIFYYFSLLKNLCPPPPFGFMFSYIAKPCI
jgi:hypothetical protein